MVVHFPDTNGIEEVAIAFRHFSTGQTHCGLLYRASDRSINMLHLQWHCDLHNESGVPAEYGWTVPAIPLERAKQVSQLCRLVWRKHPEIPYGFHYVPCKLFSLVDGSLELQEGMRGFTCATFVLAIFERCEMSLLELETWPHRESDEVWQAHMLAVMRRRTPHIDTRHIEGVAAEIGCLRYRPEEVAGACLVRNLPASFEEATASAQLVLRSLEQYYARKGIV